MTLQQLKNVNRSTIALIAAGMAIAGGSLYYTVNQVRQEPAEPVRSTPVNESIAALGRSVPVSEVVSVSVASTLRNDRVKRLLVQRGDRVRVDRVIAILESYDRLQTALLEAQERVRVANAKLAQVKAGAKSGEISAQKAEIDRIQAQSLGEERAQRESLARLEAQWLGDKSSQQAALAGLEAQLVGDIQVQSATIKKLAAELNNARSELRRYGQLYAAGAIPQSQYETKRLSVDTAIQQLNEVQAGLVRTKATGDRKISEAKANLQRTITTGSKQISEAKIVLARIRSTGDRQVTSAQGTLSKIVEVRPVDVQAVQVEIDLANATLKRVRSELNEATIRAPMSGTVLEIHTHAGEAIAEAGIVDLGSTDQMEVLAEVYQSDIDRVRNGRVATITSDAFAGEIKGMVRQLGQQVSQQKVFSNQPGENLDRRIVEVRIRLNAADSQRISNLTNLQVQVAIQP